MPTVESFLAAEGKVEAIRPVGGFSRRDLHALWDDLKFGLKHYSDFDRIAMVGERKWEKWMVQVSKPFTKAKMRYFDASQVDEAWAWLREGVESSLRLDLRETAASLVRP